MPRETNNWSPSIYKSECPVDWTAERERSYNFQAPVWNGLKVTGRQSRALVCQSSVNKAALVVCQKPVNK